MAFEMKPLSCNLFTLRGLSEKNSSSVAMKIITAVRSDGRLFAAIGKAWVATRAG